MKEEYSEWCQHSCGAKTFKIYYIMFYRNNGDHDYFLGLCRAQIISNDVTKYTTDELK